MFLQSFSYIAAIQLTKKQSVIPQNWKHHSHKMSHCRFCICGTVKPVFFSLRLLSNAIQVTKGKACIIVLHQQYFPGLPASLWQISLRQVGDWHQTRG